MVKAGKLQVTTRQTGSLHMFAVTSGGCSLVQQLSKESFFANTLFNPPSRRPSRRLESLWDSHLRAELRVLPHDHHLRHYRQRPQCRTRDACPPVRRQHQWLHIGWSSLYVIPPVPAKNYLVLVDTDLLRRRKSTHMARHTVPHTMRSAMLETWATSRLMRKGMARESLLTRKSN